MKITITNNKLIPFEKIAEGTVSKTRLPMTITSKLSQLLMKIPAQKIGTLSA